MAAWLIRYAAFAIGSPEWLIISGIALHGVCHVFLIIVIQLYVDSQCPADQRASAQNLFAFLTMGIAMPLGFWFSGRLADWSAVEETGQLDPRIFFAVPAGIVLLLLVIYVRWFRLYSTGDADGSGNGDGTDDGSPDSPAIHEQRETSVSGGSS
jgi:MFS family permease